MVEKEKKELLDDKADKRAIERERKILSVLLPTLGVISFILGVVGAILTATGNPIETGTLVFYVILTVLGVLGILYGVVVIIRKKNPDFLRKKKEEEEPPLSD